VEDEQILQIGVAVSSFKNQHFGMHCADQAGKGKNSSHLAGGEKGTG
jgi:hypothetical protein